MSSSRTPIRYTAGELRERMPTITAWLDDMRAAFGTDVINASIKDGIAGKPRFYAIENGVEVGTMPPPKETTNVDVVLRMLRMGR